MHGIAETSSPLKQWGTKNNIWDSKISTINHGAVKIILCIENRKYWVLKPVQSCVKSTVLNITTATSTTSCVLKPARLGESNTRTGTILSNFEAPYSWVICTEPIKYCKVNLCTVLYTPLKPSILKPSGIVYKYIPARHCKSQGDIHIVRTYKNCVLEYWRPVRL